MERSLETNYKDKVLAANSIPTLPVALQKTMALMDGPRTNLAKVGTVISQDQSLSARVLKMVNSPVYGFPSRIASIHNALVLLGVNTVHGILISSVVFDIVSKHMAGLWNHSLSCSTACNVIARMLNVKDIEEYMLAGLLHDFGKVVIAIQIPDASRDINALIRSEDVLSIEAEQLMLGFGHPRVNKWVAAHWNLPAGISAAMVFHHNPMVAGSHKTLASVVHLGDFLARLFEIGSSGDSNVSELDPHALKHLGFDQSDLHEIVDRVGIEFKKQGMFPVFKR